MARPPTQRVVRAAEQLGEHLRTWRKLQRLTVEQVAERAGVTRNTVSRLEHGDLSVGLEVVLNVSRALGQLERLVSSIDPYDTDLGRARADEVLPQRVRR